MNLKTLSDADLMRDQNSIQGDMDDALAVEDFETHQRLLAILKEMNSELERRGLLWTPADRRVFPA